MKIRIMVLSRYVSGATSVYGPVLRRLNLAIRGAYGSMIETVEFEPCLPAAVRAPDEHDAQKFGKIPRVVIKLRKKLATVRFMSQFATAGDVESIAIRPELCNKALGEIGDAMELLRPRFNPSDDFDIDQFITDCRQVLAVPFASVEEIRELDQVEIPVDDTLTWESPEVDWTDKRYHSDARRILDDPRFWSRGDEFSPHGSDTGSDLLDDYLRNRVGQGEGEAYADRIIKEWGVSATHWDVTESVDCRKLYELNRQYYTIRNQVVLGVAFAELKTQATCSCGLAKKALRALQRENFDFVETLPQFVGTRQLMLSLMERVLKAFV